MATTKATILSIGDELLIGQVVNTNASWLAENLTLLGFNVVSIITVSDSEAAIIGALDQAEKNTELVIITGGLGPTKDDITKVAFCKFFNTSLVFSESAFNDISELFLRRNIAVSETNRNQAEVPLGSVIIPNKNGTAPGLWFQKNNCVFVALPGVPFEMKEIFNNFLIEKLSAFYSLASIVQSTAHTIGIPESNLSDMLTTWESNLKRDGLKLAYLPQPGIVRLRITAYGFEESNARKLINLYIEELNKIIPDSIFGYDYDTLEIALGKMLKTINKTISVAESCTGGRIAHMITSVPGCSSYFFGGIVAYANQVKSDMLSIDSSLIEKHGAVSKEVVEQMAVECRKKFNTDFAVATSGIAGPDGGTPDKPVGTVWMAVADENNVISEKHVFGKLRDVNISRASVLALNLLRKQLLNMHRK